MRKNNSKPKISYEPEADVLMWEIANQRIDYAEQIGDVIVHFTKKNTPVLIEILKASKFLAKSKELIKDSLSIHKKAVVSLR